MAGNALHGQRMRAGLAAGDPDCVAAAGAYCELTSAARRRQRRCQTAVRWSIRHRLALGRLLAEGEIFDAEAEDYKKEVVARMLDYEGLEKCASEKKMDVSLENRVVEVNCDADCRYHFGTMNISAAQRKGELSLQSAPLMEEKWVVQNDDAEPYQRVREVASCPCGATLGMEETAKQGIPPVCENIELPILQVLTNQLHTASTMMLGGVEDVKSEFMEEENAAWRKDKLPVAATHHKKNLTAKYAEARDHVETEVNNMEGCRRSQRHERLQHHWWPNDFGRFRRFPFFTAYDVDAVVSVPRKHVRLIVEAMIEDEAFDASGMNGHGG